MKKLYHATCVSKRESIQTKGLEPRLSRRWNFGYKDKRIYLFGDLEKPPLDYVGNYDIDIWEVTINDNCLINEDTNAIIDGYKNSFYINEAIPPERISLIKTIN